MCWAQFYLVILQWIKTDKVPPHLLYGAAICEQGDDSTNTLNKQDHFLQGECCGGAEGSGTTLDAVVKDSLSVEVTLEPSPDPQGGARLRKVQGRGPGPGPKARVSLVCGPETVMPEEGGKWRWGHRCNKGQILQGRQGVWIVLWTQWEAT